MTRGPAGQNGRLNIKQVNQKKKAKARNKSPSVIASENGTIELKDWNNIAEASSLESPVFARLQPVDPRVDPIELFAPVSLFGRTLRQKSGQQQYDFSRLLALGGEVGFVISRQQFKIERDTKNGKTYVIDTSRNGTFINQARLVNGDRSPLNHADVISVGKADFYFWIYDERRMVDFPPKLVDKYIVSNMELGHGGYSKVLLAKVRNCVSKRVAIKILNRSMASQSRQCADLDDIKREIEVMCSIHNPFCMSYLDYFEDNDRSFIVLEYAGGGDLFERITEVVDSKGEACGLKENIAKLYTFQIMNALEYLHARGITHRDIKPENILLVEKADITIVKLCDFGLAKALYQCSTMNSYVGTPSYIAPEVRDSADSYTSAVDMWSYGVVLFLMLSGYPPFCESYTDMDLEEQIHSGRLIFTSRWKQISRHAQALVRKMLTVDYSDRITARDALRHAWFDGERLREQVKFLLNKDKET